MKNPLKNKSIIIKINQIFILKQKIISKKQKNKIKKNVLIFISKENKNKNNQKILK